MEGNGSLGGGTLWGEGKNRTEGTLYLKVCIRKEHAKPIRGEWLGGKKETEPTFLEHNSKRRNKIFGCPEELGSVCFTLGESVPRKEVLSRKGSSDCDSGQGKGQPSGRRSLLKKQICGQKETALIAT